MDKLPLALIIGLIIGVPFGLYVALVSHRHENVKGGAVAQCFHALGAICICTALPGVLVMAFSGAGFLNTIFFGFSAVLCSFLSLCVYAAFERPALEKAAQIEDRGWTAEQAKSSGL